MRRFKKLFLCMDGPFKGHHLLLAPDATTLRFHVRGVTGRYVPSGTNTVRWEAGQ